MRTSGFRMRAAGCVMAVLAGWMAVGDDVRAADRTFREVVIRIQPRMVKIYGAGGLSGLESYQSGFLISAEGHLLTVWSYVLDTDYITVVLDDGRKFKAELAGADPRLEIAVLKIDAADLPHFNLSESAELDSGDRVLAFSNLYGVATGNEPASVLHGSVAAKTDLAARRGAFDTPFKGQVYVVDAMTNNPGAAGGALTDRRGQLVGMLGKELRNSLNNTWLNYALPAPELVDSVDDILAGRAVSVRPDENQQKPDKPLTLALLGIVLVPDVLAKTPPFVDDVRPGSPAAAAGLKPDDLILFINDRMAGSCRNLTAELTFIDRIDPITLTVQRGQDLIETELKAQEK